MLFLFKHNHKNKIIVNSIPKSGTNLLGNIVCSIPGLKAGQSIKSVFFIDNGYSHVKHIQEIVKRAEKQSVHKAHIPYSEEYAYWLKKNNIKQLFIYRDPRDYVVSLYYYLHKTINKNKHAHVVKDKTRNEGLMSIIEGTNRGKSEFIFSTEKKDYPGVNLMFKNFENWLGDTNTYSIRFEDVINFEKAGRKEQEKLYKLFSFLGYTFFKKKIAKIIAKGKQPERSKTFRQGKSGSWKEELTNDHLDSIYQLFDNTKFNYFNFF